MNIVIAGAGTYGAVYHHYLEELNQYKIFGYVDDNPEKIGRYFSDLPIICKTTDFQKLKEHDVEGVFCPIGNNKIRRKLLRQYLDYGFHVPNYIHNSVIIPNDIKIGQGVYILPGSIIMPFVEIRDFVMISMGVKVAHHTILDEGAFLSTGANIGANINFGECAFAGIGSTVTTGVERIGRYSTIGAGAVIIKNIDDNQVFAGNPGRLLKDY